MLEELTLSSVGVLSDVMYELFLLGAGCVGKKDWLLSNFQLRMNSVRLR